MAPALTVPGTVNEPVPCDVARLQRSAVYRLFTVPGTVRNVSRAWPMAGTAGAGPPPSSRLQDDDARTTTSTGKMIARGPTPGASISSTALVAATVELLAVLADRGQRRMRE